MIEKLQEIGLSENEARVYIALLKIGPSTTGPIIKKSGLYRVIIYDTLEKLLQLGLVFYSVRKNRKVFEAEKPSQLLELIKNKEITAKSIIQNLQNLRNERPMERAAYIYEGWKGIKAAQENYFKEMKHGASGEYLMIGASRELHKKLDAFFNYFHERRAKLKIPAKLLFNENNRAYGKLKSKFRPVQIKYMPARLVTPSWMSMYKDMVLIGVTQDMPMAFFIKNKAVADTYTKYFYLMWDSAEG